MIQTEFTKMTIKGRQLLPIIQGGMGVGVSGHRLAGHVAREGAVGTIASVDLHVLHKDLWARSRRVRDKAVIEALNLEALDREIRAAKEIAAGNGMVAVNVMKAVDMHASLVRQACESGADAVIMGAGLPLDLPELAEGYDDVALIPILSEERGVRAVLKKWQRKGRLPDAIVIEHPRYAGGHLGATRLEEVNSERFDFAGVFAKIFDIFDQLGIGRQTIPLIAAGGVNTLQRLRDVMRLGASGAQIGTPFAVTQEGDAHPNFKQVLLKARAKDIVTFMSTAGLPARAVLTPWLERYLKREQRRRFRAKPGKGSCALGVECLTHCGLKDGNPNCGQFCIDLQLQAAVRGNVDKGLFFRGSESLPLGDRLASVRELLEYYLLPRSPAV